MPNIPKSAAYTILVIIVSFAFMSALFFLDRYNDSILIRRNWNYEIEDFGFPEVLKLWLVSLLGAALFIAIIKFFWFLLPKLPTHKFNRLLINNLVNRYYELIQVINNSYLKIFCISVISSTLFLFIDIPKGFDINSNILHNFLPKEATTLYKNEHLRGRIVEDIQRILVNYEYQLQVDGKYGAITQEKVVEELAKNNINLADDQLDYAGTYLLTEYAKGNLYIKEQLSNDIFFVFFKVFIYTFLAISLRYANPQISIHRN